MAGEFTDRMREVLHAIQDHKTPREITTELGMSPQQVANNIRKLRRHGYITRTIPDYVVYAKHYPWEVTQDAPMPAPRLPAGARVRVEHAIEDQRDLAVEPITVIRWDGWSVQGVPTLHPDGKSVRQQAPPYRLVFVQCQQQEPPRGSLPASRPWGACFAASRTQPWTQRDTEAVWEWELRQDFATTGWDHRDMTLIIAAVVGVEAVLDDQK